MYSAENWHWIVGGDASQAWSSAARAYVTEYPADRVTRIASEAELRDVLEAASCPDRAPGYVPKIVSMAQARVALRRAGLLEAVQAAVSQAGGETLDAWEYATQVSRHSALVTALAGALGLSTQQVDDLFRAAEGITF
jgi:UDP-N-acetylmuramoylalanine-D-glutamate ligase